MRIAFFVSGFPIRSETFILTQIKGLLDRGHDVDVFANEIHDPADLHAGFRKYRLLERTRRRRAVTASSLPNRLLRRARRIAANIFRHPALIFRSLNVFKYGKGVLSLDLPDMALCFADRPAYDVVHCHFGPNGNDAAALIDLGVLRGKLVTTFHSYDILSGIRTKGRMYRRLRRHADGIHSISEYNRKWLEYFGFSPEKIHYHPMGIDLAPFAGAERRDAPNGHVRILSVARLVPEKGLEYALIALAEVRRKRPDLEFRYRVIGGGPVRASLQAKAKQLGLSDIVQFSGAQDQEVVREALRDADVFLLPSLAEALPIAIMEAMASSLPVIATDVGGVSELVHNGQTGCLIPPGDAGLLERAVLEMLARPRAEWRRLGQAGRALVMRRHDTAVLADRLVAHYRSLLADGQMTGEARYAQLGRR